MINIIANIIGVKNSGAAGGGGGVPANALLWDDGTPVLWDDGSYVLWE